MTLWKTKLHNPLPDLLIITGPSIPGSSTAIRLPRRHRSHLVDVVSQIFSSVASLIVSSFANLSPVSLYKSNQQLKKKKNGADGHEFLFILSKLNHAIYHISLWLLTKIFSLLPTPIHSFSIQFKKKHSPLLIRLSHHFSISISPDV